MRRYRTGFATLVLGCVSGLLLHSFRSGVAFLAAGGALSSGGVRSRVGWALQPGTDSSQAPQGEAQKDVGSPNWSLAVASSVIVSATLTSALARTRCQSSAAARKSAASSQRSARVGMHAAAKTPVSTEATEGGDVVATALEVGKAVLLALLDIFKGPPTEPTGADSPFLKELGPEGVIGALKGCSVQSLKDGSTIDAAELLKNAGGKKTLVVFATHFGDFNSWEEAQKLTTALEKKRLEGVRVSLIGIGPVSAGKKFVELLELPDGVDVFADGTAACHNALGFSKGALPQYKEQLNPYFRVFLMLLGVGSPGTISTVLSGYFGNKALSETEVAWVDAALKQGARQGRFPTTVPQRLPWEEKKAGESEWVELATAGSTVWDGRGFGETGLRPFELATVRLQNMVSGIIANWGSLTPADDELLVQQGGAVVLGPSGECLYFYRDKGILTYVPMEDALAALK